MRRLRTNTARPGLERRRACQASDGSIPCTDVIRDVPLVLVALLGVVLTACGPGKSEAALRDPPVGARAGSSLGGSRSEARLTPDSDRQPDAAASPARWTWTPVSIDMGGSGYCPVGTQYQLPNHPELFISRTAYTPVCSGPNAYTLALFKMDWATNTLHFVKTLMDLPATARGGLTIKVAIDPAAALYRGEIWVSFVCVAGFGDNSSCVAPLDLQTGQIDLTRLTVPMRGVKSPASDWRFSAGVPKLFVYQDRLYMYSSVVAHLPRSPDGKWTRAGSVSARGVELEEKGRVMWAATASGYANSTDPEAVDVLPLKAGDPTADVIADIFDVKEINGRILVTASLGGSGSGATEEYCIMPIVMKSRGCYRLEIHQGSAPLGPGVFSRTISTDADLPANPTNYDHFIVLPNGQTALMMWAFKARPEDQPPNIIVQPGLGILTTPVLQ
jgi:hypothetical protein